MLPGFIMLLPLLLFVVVGWRLRKRYVTTAHRQAKVAKISVFLFAAVCVLMGVRYWNDHHPFWPRQAFTFACVAVVLVSQIYSWQEAKRQAALEPSPSPTPPRPPTFLWQAVLILLPVLIMTVIGLVALSRDRTAVENEARQRAEELIERLQDTFGRRVASELSTISG